MFHGRFNIFVLLRCDRNFVSLAVRPMPIYTTPLAAISAEIVSKTYFWTARNDPLLLADTAFAKAENQQGDEKKRKEEEERKKERRKKEEKRKTREITWLLER